MTKTVAILLSILTTVIFCFHLFVTKIILVDLPPLIFAATRGVIGGVILSAFFWKDIKKHLSKKLFIQLTFVGFLGFFINQIFFMYGMRLSSAIDAAIIINAIPITTAMLAIIFSQENFSWRKIIGILIGLVTIIFYTFVSNHAQQDGKQTSLLGDLLIFLNVLSFAGAITLGKKVMSKDIPSSLISVGMILLGGIMLFIISISELPLVVNYTFKSSSNFFLMLFSAVFSTAVTYWLMFLTLKVLTPSQNTIFIYFQPPLTALIGFALFNIQPSLILIPVIVLVTIAGYLVLVKNRSELFK